MKSNHLEGALVTPTSPEEVDAAHLQTLTEEDLVSECMNRLLVSFEHQGVAFHDTHDAVSRARLECDRREQSSLFDVAFRAAFHDH